MDGFIKVVPVDGAKVRHPDFPRMYIPEGGERVRRAMYWDRMEKQGVIKFEEVSDEAPEESQEEKPVIPQVSADKPVTVRKGGKDAV